MLEILQKSFPEKMEEWESKIKEMIPSYGKSLMENPELLDEIHAFTDGALGLNQKELTHS